MSDKKKTRILILGGALGGMYAAMHLDKTARRDPDIQVTLVNQDNFFLFTPMLHEVAACDLDFTISSTRSATAAPRSVFSRAMSRRLIWQRGRVTVSHGSDSHTLI